VFGDNDEFDELRREAGQEGRSVEVTGVISGFDGPYPVVSVREYRLERIVEPENEEAETEETEEVEEKEEGKKPAYDYLKKSKRSKAK
jgi:hypothetical protein